MTAGANKLGFTRYYNMLPNSFTGVSGLPTIFAATLGPNWRNGYDRYLQLVSTNNQLTAILGNLGSSLVGLDLPDKIREGIPFYEEALVLTDNVVERTYIEQRLAELDAC